MTEPTQPSPAASTRLRVAPREVLDAAYRAMRVAGATAGEAQLAAKAVLLAELAGTGGLALLLDELPKVSRDRVAGRLLVGPDVTILDDPAGRGLFYSVPAAVETCQATGFDRPVLLPGAEWRAALFSIVDSCAGPDGPAVCAAQLDERQKPVAGDTGAAGRIAQRLRSSLPAGVIIWTAGTKPHPSAHRAAVTPERRADAARTGLAVDRRLWVAANSAARGYLVPER